MKKIGGTFLLFLTVTMGLVAQDELNTKEKRQLKLWLPGPLILGLRHQPPSIINLLR